jgi:hypothetical protein
MRPYALIALVTLLVSLGTGRASAAPSLEGRWEMPNTATRFHFVRIVHEFKGERATMTAFFQTSIPYQARALKLVRTGTVRVVGPSAAVAGAFEVDVKVEKITVTPLDPDTVWLGNGDEDRLCGISGWQRGVPQDVSGKVCYGNEMASPGDVEKILAKVDGDQLLLSPFWGEGAVVPDAPAVAVRSAVLDTARPMVRAHGH